MRYTENTTESLLEKYKLVYVTDEKLDIERRKLGKDFVYQIRDKKLTQKEHIERIKTLAIPPAWQGVKITSLENGHLQATGRDAKKRKQYRYHPLWSKIRNQTKFSKMYDFGKLLPSIRRRVDADLDLEGWPKNKVMALIIRLMEETHIRIGNEQYAKRNKTYGLSTLRKRHLKIFDDKLKFHFTGKRGKEHSITLKNKRLIRLVNRCEEIPGWELFHFYDKNGDKQKVESEMVNEYIYDISTSNFTAKDFRTWAASILFFEFLAESEPAQSEKQKDKTVLAALDAAAAALGNTRNVCRKYYVHPHLITSYTSGKLLPYLLDIDKQQDDEFLTASEKAMLEAIKNYQPGK
ncbi:DNA topoisomerase IB [Sungkyunkwania multivorans]|uniref:DNA topoisomerase n=1 Tax=Sungkyunkwania multivorans TaxID=1173618 RepID=A0ABW3CTP3_9FLAO